MSSNRTLLKPLGYQKKDSCGYCKDGAGSSCYYMSCEKMRIDHYQELIDRGWRRSGTLYYKQDLTHSCCPHYTIRLDAAAFKAKKDQRRAWNQWNRHVRGHEYTRREAILYPQSREEKRQKRDRFDVLDVVHLSEYSKLRRPTSRTTGKPIEPDHKFEVTLESDMFTREKYEVFLKYQISIHKDPKSRWGHAAFKRFLCSGLNRSTVKTCGKTQKLGSYHQCYRIDEKLIAVGVLDLLPHAVSSVYLFYDPDYEQWELGKLSALREIALALEGGYRYYYMGFYIHSCVKMKYKGEYSPSYILDPESLEWHLLDDEFRVMLDKSPYVSLARDRKSATEDGQAPKLEETVAEPGSTAKGQKYQPTSQHKDTPPGLDVDSDDSDGEDTEIPEGSLFSYNMPGVLKKEEVAKLDLDHWKLLVRGSLVDLEDLRGWENWSLDDPYSIKGIAGELAATIGPKVMENSAIVLF